MSLYTQEKATVFICDVCHEYFFHKNELNEHILKHTGEKPFCCDVCHKGFSKSELLQRHHRLLHKAEKPYNCHICNRGFIWKYSLKVHMQIHSGERPFVCSICKKSFSNENILKIHNIRKHNARKKSFFCDLCQEGFFFQSDLNAHKKSQLKKGQTYPCDSCPRKFCTRLHLRIHLLVEHLSSEGVPGKGPSHNICDEGSSLKTNKDQNPDTHSGDKLFSCVICQKTFSKKNDLDLHIRNHSIQRKRKRKNMNIYSCSRCKKAFRARYLLTRHMYLQHRQKESPVWKLLNKIHNHKLNIGLHLTHSENKALSATHNCIHTGEKSFYCDVCNKEFSKKCCLQKHLRIHTGVKPFSCDVCSKKNYFRWHLKRHRATNTGSKPFSCDVCDKRKDLLDEHLHTHTSFETFWCYFCKKGFCRKNNWINHLHGHIAERAFFV